MKIKTIMKVALKKMLSLEVKEVTTDKGVLLYDAEELAEGVEVFMKEGEELVAAPDGDYTTETEVITVVEGKVSAITPIEKEEEPVEEPAEEPVEVEAAAEVVEEPAAEPIEEEPAEEGDGLAELKGKVDDLVLAMTDLTNKLAALQGAYDELNERMAKIETEPAAEPVEVEVEEPVKASRMSYLKKK